MAGTEHGVEMTSRARAGARDVSVDLLRIVGALMVIGAHINLENLIDGKPSMKRILVSCVVGDGVAVFWLVLGCFYFAGAAYGLRLKKLLVRVIIPMVLFSAFTYYFHGVLCEGKTLAQSLSHTGEERLALLQGLMTWDNAVKGTNHFWYLYVYILVILICPILAAYRNTIVDTKKEWVLIAILFCVFVYNDLSGNRFAGFSHHGFNGVMGACPFVFLGDFLYRHRRYFQGNVRLGLIGAAAWIGISLGRAYLVRFCYGLPQPVDEPLFWYTSYAFLSVTALTVCVFGLSGLVRNIKLERVIIQIGRCTFGVYLIHMLVRNFYQSRGMNLRILEIVHGSVFGYQILYTLLIFGTSLAIVEVWVLFRMLLGTGKRNRDAK